MKCKKVVATGKSKAPFYTKTGIVQFTFTEYVFINLHKCFYVNVQRFTFIKPLISMQLNLSLCEWPVKRSSKGCPNCHLNKQIAERLEDDHKL